MRMTLDPLHGVAGLDRGNRGTVRGRSLDRAIDHLSTDEWARGVVDEHDLGGWIDARKGIRDGILPPGAARHDGQRPRRRTDVGLRFRRLELLGHDDHQIGDRRVRVERHDAARKDRAAAKIQELLGLTGAHPASGAAGGDDCGHAHVAVFIIDASTIRTVLNGCGFGVRRLWL